MSSDDESSLDDLFSGRDRFMTSGEVAELLNVNTNTLYLWRQSGEVDLPFHRFIAPGQSRGMIRYRYSDVAKFIARAASMGRVFLEESPKESDQRAEDILRSKKSALRVEQIKNKKVKDKELSRPLDEILAESVPDSDDVPESLPAPVANADDIIKDILRSYLDSESA
jgi:hypothetical protein